MSRFDLDIHPAAALAYGRTVEARPDARIEEGRIVLGRSLVSTPPEDFIFWELPDTDTESEAAVLSFVRRFGIVGESRWSDEEDAEVYDLVQVADEIGYLQHNVTAMLWLAEALTWEEYQAGYPGDEEWRVADDVLEELTDRLAPYTPAVGLQGRGFSSVRDAGSVVALDLFNLLVTGELATARRCAWPSCARLFIWQRGRSRWQHRTGETVLYCSAAHASAASSKAHRDRKRLEAFVARRREQGVTWQQIAEEWSGKHPGDAMSGAAMRRRFERMTTGGE